jgi:hypothetical protein
MPFVFGLVLAGLVVSACAERSPSPGERFERDENALREWIRGPMMDTCVLLPGPESRHACVMIFDGALARLLGESLTAGDQLRIETAKVKAFDETRSLWTKTEQEWWLQGPKTAACRQAPLPRYARLCLEGIQEDLDQVHRSDDRTVERQDLLQAVVHEEHT